MGLFRCHVGDCANNRLFAREGLRISDAATFHRQRLMADGSIFLYMSKTNEPVSVPVHPELKAALDAIQPNAAGYYFWSGESAITTATEAVRTQWNAQPSGSVPPK